MAFTITGGAGLNATPSATKQTLAGNYLDFTSQSTTAADKNWAQQYLPDLMEKEAEVFGNRTVSGFLEKVGAEEAMASDQVVWSEQGRLHLSYQCSQVSEGVILIEADVDGNVGAANGVRIGDMVVLSDADKTVKAYVTGTYAETTAITTAGQITVASYTSATIGLDTTSKACRLFVFGSEYEKGTEGRGAVNAPAFKSHSNQPIILKDKYEVSGSDASAVGWVEVSGEEGQNGYLWYLKAAGDTKSRFTDYCEMALIEAEKVVAGSDVASLSGEIKGTEGLFAAISDRGNIAAQVNSMDDFDDILKEFDKQGSIEENMMFLDREQALLIDDILAAQNGGNAGDGSAYGVFDNDQDMALNLGFSGFRRGSYDFYKTDWKYLNDLATRGSINDAAATGATRLGDIYGCIVPAGVSTVYDQSLGKNLKRPFLHVRYRASGVESRKFKTWTTGSVGAVSSDLDAMEMHFLSERCLVVQGANNFMLIKGKQNS